MIRVVIPALFVAAVALLAYLKPPPCISVYLGAVLYAVFLPAGRLATWRVDKRLPLAFLPYFASLMTAGAVMTYVQPIRDEFQRLRNAQGEFFSSAASCPAGMPLTALQVLVFAPLVEEIIFRGLLFEAVRARFGIAAAYLISSAVFAALHRPGLGAVPIFIIAISLAFAYHKFGLPASIALHFFQNVVAFWTSQNLW